MRKQFVVIAGLSLALGVTAQSEAKGTRVEARFVRCSAVTAPAALAGCGSDSLVRGELSVEKGGDVKIEIEGAVANQTYEALLRALDGSPDMSLGVVMTDATGKGEMARRNLFDLDQAGPVSFLLTRAGSVQFVAGSDGTEDSELEAGLVRCGDMNVPEAPAGCGTDTLRDGKTKLEDEALKVEVNGAGANVTYNVVFRGLDGTETAVGTMATNRMGKGQFRQDGAFTPSAVVAGNVVLRRDSADQFISGFQSTRKRAPQVAKFTADMVRCVEVNTLAALTGCGADLFGKGQVIIDEKGDVKVQLFDAVPDATYEVFFVAFNASSEVSLGTLATNPAGNGHLFATDAFPVGTRGAGNVVVKRNGVDQFVTGFRVVR